MYSLFYAVEPSAPDFTSPERDEIVIVLLLYENLFPKTVRATPYELLS